MSLASASRGRVRILGVALAWALALALALEMDTVDLWKRVLKRKREQQLSKARESKDSMAEPMDIEVDARTGGVQVYSNSNFEPFALVPPEIRNHIFSFLDYKGVGRAARVCKKWHEECDRYGLDRMHSVFV